MRQHQGRPKDDRGAGAWTPSPSLLNAKFFPKLVSPGDLPHAANSPHTQTFCMRHTRYSNCLHFGIGNVFLPGLPSGTVAQMVEHARRKRIRLTRRATVHALHGEMTERTAARAGPASTVWARPQHSPWRVRGHVTARGYRTTPLVATRVCACLRAGFISRQPSLPMRL